MIPIEKNIPMPKNSAGKPKKYPFAEMAIGDSFLNPNVDGKKNLIQQATCGFSRKHPGFKFATRREATGIRVWRIEAKKEGAS